MAAQVDPIKTTLKPPGTKRLKLKYDKPLSNFAFNFNLRRYTKEYPDLFKEEVGTQANITRRVIDTHFEPSFLELKMTSYDEQHLPGPLPATLSTHILSHRFLSHVGSYDVASNTCQASARHVIDTHFEPSFLESRGVL